MTKQEREMRTLVMVLLLDASVNPPSDLQCHVLDTIRERCHITPNQVDKLRDHMQTVQRTQLVSGGQNLTLDQVVEVALAHGASLD
jgi:hypothetical protein